ncbi:MAG: dihydrolipoyl dehydrogenase [Planctomycetes bacterium GWF2_41_51]|nr:MAG: dihydrolipoyl dehydrogenase [Planctomycetes bacterium GWF2_41_51]
MAEKFDIAVIGSGPGGYTAALRCAQKGAAVAIIEKDAIGGVCLNCGCIPSKALLASAHVFNLAKKAASFGVELDNPRVNWPKMQSSKDAIVSGLRKGLTGLIMGNKIKIFEGTGIVTAPGKIAVSGNNPTEIEANKIIISTGSISTELPFIPFDGKTIISSTEALALAEIPKSMIVIGGGFIGCELGCVYASVGTKVTIIEALQNILPLEDEWIGKLMTRELKKMGMEILTGKKVTGSEKTESGANILLEDGSSIEAEKILVSVGRRAYCDKQTVDNLSLEMNNRLIKVNNRMETNVPGVYAIGDVVGTTYLAHGAYYEGQVAAINATGGNAEVKDYHLVPRAIYTFPEVAGVGLTETKCKQQGIEYTIGKSFFKANGRSLAHQETVGEIRVIRDKSTSKVLGVTMLGDNVTELVAIARALIGSSEKIDDIVFAHPTVSEVLKEAWLGFAH